MYKAIIINTVIVYQNIINTRKNCGIEKEKEPIRVLGTFTISWCSDVRLSTGVYFLREGT